MGYLRLRDFDLPIQGTELNQMLTNKPYVRLQAESFAKAEMISKLTQRYDVDREFQETLPYNPTKVYNAWDLVDIDFPSYDPTKIYAVNVGVVIQAGLGYICNTTITVPEAFNIAKWTLLGAQYDLFFVATPHEDFNYKAFYKVGDKVFWRNKVYTALQESTPASHFTNLQSNSYAEVPFYNVFPDSPISGPVAWGAGVVYNVSAGTLPTNTTKWTAGDNRSQMCMEHMLAIAIYKMTQRIAINNVPENRVTAYEQSLIWLREVSHGDINCDIPERQPEQGNPVMWGGQIKRINQW
jgi:hypothetical protein